MKKFKTAICLLMLLSVVITAIMLQFMPDIVPAHYNMAGEVDRLGSKYESLLFPAITVAMGLFFLLVDRFVPRDKDGRKRKPEDTVIAASGILTLLYFISMSIVFMGKGIAYGRTGTASVAGIDSAGFISVVVIFLGILLVLLGNYMPKARVNAIFGVRTKWSMANDRVWQKSQRFGAITSVICGIAMIVLAAFVRKALLLWVIILLLFWSAALITVSYVYYRKDRTPH